MNSAVDCKALLMNARAREIGLNAVEVARLACAAIASIDDELSRLPSSPDAAGRADVIQKRTRLATGLQTLCEQQLRVSREDSDEAIHRLVASVHSLTCEIGGSVPQDSATDSATRLGATGLGLTLPAATIDRAPRQEM